MQEDTPLPADLKRIGRYRIVRPLSKGGMAMVYEARRESLAGVSPRVAVKVILPEHQTSDTFKNLFINEARLGAKMHHQNLVQIQDFDAEGDRFFLVMEYVEGITLRKVISQCVRFEIEVPALFVAEVGRQAADGLHYAHEATDEAGNSLQLVHRDMKPSNLILNPHGVIKIVDFGISKGVLRKEKSGSVKGTWGYMAPEQARGSTVGPPTDVFGLAIVLYELAARKPMFRGKSQDEIKRLLQDDHAARMAATVDPQYRPLIPVLVRALQRDPKARYATAEEFGRALSALLPDPITARDQVVSFYETLDNMERGGVAPVSKKEAPAAPSLDSSVAGPTPQAPAAIWPVLLGMLMSMTVLLVLIGAAIVGVSHLVGLTSSDEVPATPDLPVEPAAAEIEPPPAPEPPAPRTRMKVVRPPPAPPAPPAASPEPTEIAVTVVTPSAEPASDPTPTAAATSWAESAGAAPATLSIGAIQPGAEVYIQGQFVRQVPVKKELPPGRYVIGIIAPDGRAKRFVVELQPGDQIRKVWDFDRGEWR